MVVLATELKTDRQHLLHEWEVYYEWSLAHNRMRCPTFSQWLPDEYANRECRLEAWPAVFLPSDQQLHPECDTGAGHPACPKPRPAASLHHAGHWCHEETGTLLSYCSLSLYFCSLSVSVSLLQTGEVKVFSLPDLLCASVCSAISASEVINWMCSYRFSRGIVLLAPVVFDSCLILFVL